MIGALVVIEHPSALTYLHGLSLDPWGFFMGERSAEKKTERHERRSVFFFPFPLFVL